jgi:hypothetical protein
MSQFKITKKTDNKFYLLNKNSSFKIYSDNNSPAFDSSYVSILNYASSQNYSLPSSNQQILQNNLVVELKNSDIWNKLDVLWVYATDAGSDFARINWKNPGSHTDSLINNPEFISNQGFKGNGTNSYINHNWNPVTDGVNFKTNDASIMVWAYALSGNSWFTGIASTTRQGFNNVTSRAQRINSSSNFNETAFPYGGTGYKSISKTSSLSGTLTNGSIITNVTYPNDTDSNESHLALRTGNTYSAHTISITAYGGSIDEYDSVFKNITDNYMANL